MGGGGEREEKRRVKVKENEQVLRGQKKPKKPNTRFGLTCVVLLHYALGK